MKLELSEKHLILSVNDTGIGIPHDKLSQVLNGKSLKHLGNGLGLSGVKEYMKQLEGTLEVYSEYGQGTTVVLKFLSHKNVE